MRDRFYVWTKTISCAFLLVFLSSFVIGTWHWPLMGDAALMHYAVFLMRHGLVLYRDIIDPNMPTTFFVEGAVVHLFGGGSLPWRLFDFSLLSVIGIAMVVISRPYGWFAGFFSGALFALIHGRDGVLQLGQRDLTMTAFLVIGYAFLFESLRLPFQKTTLWLMALFGFFCGTAATIKPSVILLPFVLLLMAATTLKRKGHPFIPHLIVGFIGTLTPIVMALAYIWHKHIATEFLGTLTGLIPYSINLETRSLGHLVLHSVSSVILPLILIWLAVIVVQKKALTWERAALLVGVLFGLASFYIQRKGYPYHRYPSEAFLLLISSIDLTTVFHLKSSARLYLLQRLALAGIIVGVLIVGGGSTVHALRQDWRNREFDSLLQGDLNRLGGQELDGHIQCLDMADGCIPTLYNMSLVQATGFTYDCYMFSLAPGTERERYREAFWRAITKNPPGVFVVSSYDCEVYPAKPSYNYQRTARWPRLNDYLKTNYHLYVERIPPHMVNTGSSPSKPLGYRIYVQNSVPSVSATPTQNISDHSATRQPASAD